MTDIRKSLLCVAMLSLLLNLSAFGQGRQGGSGFDKSNLDESCAPCQDFYRYANGGWLKRHPVPPAQSAWAQFNIVSEANAEKLRVILDTAAANRKAPAGSDEKKLGDLYASCLDERMIEAAGLKPIAPLLDEISRIKDVRGLQSTVARLHLSSIDAMFNFFVSTDFNNSSANIAYASQGGLGLPDRDYYLRQDDKARETRAAYTRHIARMFELSGDDLAQAEARAKTVLAIETKLAEASMSAVQMRDVQALANRKDLAALKTLTTTFSWGDYFKQINHAEIKDVIVRQPDFFKQLDRELTATPLADWKTYLRWHALRRFAAALPAGFEDESFNFYGKYLRGSQAQLPRWRRCVSSVGSVMRDALGAQYVKQHFPAEARTRMSALVDNLLAALRDDLATLSWMSAATRTEALEKLAALKVRIGHPEKWRDYAALKIERGSYAANVMRAARFLRRDNWDQLGRAVEPGKWFVPAWTVDAFADDNAIFFPAGILQAPFFDFTAADALNYGAIGAMIGHEITHHFDDAGRQFDAKGNLRDWWTAEDAKNYAARAACIERQFSGYEAAPGVFHNGKLVLGEASSDLGGLKIAWLAYRKSLAGKSPPPLIDGFTGEQRFFLGFALMWAGNARPEWERLRAQTDPHPLARFRVNGTLANTPEFAAAFGCQPGAAMAREEKCAVW